LATPRAADSARAGVPPPVLGSGRRSRPPGRSRSRVVSLWKDPVRGLREIPLDADAHAVLIRIQVGRTTRHSADGRPPVANTANVSAEGVRQIRAPDLGDHTGVAMPEAPVDNEPAGTLQARELTILTCLAEAVAQAPTASPDPRYTLLLY